MKNENIIVSLLGSKEIYYDPANGVISDDLHFIDKYVQENCINGEIDKPLMEDDEIQGIIFVLTTKCNLDCNYCYSVAQNKPLSMQKGDTIKILEKNIRANSKALFINFFGGEPTLEMELIEETVEYLKKEAKEKTVYFRISTNGLVKEKDLDYLIDNNFHIAVSSDGIANDGSSLVKQKLIQQQQVEKTLMHLAERDAIFSIRCTVTKDNYNNLSDAIVYWHSIGVKLAHIEPCNPVGKSEAEMSLLPPMQEFISAFKNAINKATELGLWVSTGAYMNLLTPSTYFCTGASGRFKVFNPDGSVSTCYRVQSFDTSYPGFIIGNWKNDLLCPEWIENKKFLNSHAVDNMSNCSGCNIKYICSGGCLMRNLSQNGSNSEPEKLICEIKQILLKDAVLNIWNALINGKKPVVLGRFVFENLVIKNPSITNNGKQSSIMPLSFSSNQQQHTFNIYKSIGIAGNEENTILTKKIARSECL